MAWKDYFYFNKSQQRGLIVLLAAVLVAFGVDIYLTNQDKPLVQLHDDLFKEEIADFTAALQEKKMPAYTQSYRRNNEPYKRKEWNRDKPAEPELFTFNPNELDSAGFVRLGLKPFIARNIMRYRSRGGKFKTADDFAKVYALTEEQFATLKPYISVPVEEKSLTAEKTYLTVVELNTADTTTLQQVRGIYPSTARRIVSYRNKLGGFISLEQLYEIKNISPKTIERILPYLLIDSTQIRKIELNRASIDYMRSHPYINFFQAQAIYDYRRNKGKIKSMDELPKIYDESLTPDFWAKILPYLKL